MELFPLLLKRSLMLAFTLLWPTALGSWTKDCPDLLPGGRDPVTAYFKDSIIVVFPQPFAVRHEKRSVSLLS